MGNQNAFMQARLNPIYSEFAGRQGQLERSHGLRGITGSSFGNMDLTNLGIDKTRALGDAGALAEMESIAALSGIDSNILSAVLQKVQQQAALNNENYQVSGMRLQQELSSLGMGQAQIGQMMDSYYKAQTASLQAEQNRQGAFGQTIGNISYSKKAGGAYGKGGTP